MILSLYDLEKYSFSLPPSLEALTLVAVESHLDADELNEPLDFPHLRKLSLATPVPPSLLGLFRDSPLEEVELCAPPDDARAFILADRVVQFAQRHERTLKSLLVHDTVIGGMHKARLIEDWASKHAAVVTICPAPILPAFEGGSDVADDEAWTDEEA